MIKLLMISLIFMRSTATVFSRLHKWGIENDPAVEAERFTEACFVERFGRRRQSWQKTSIISVAKNLCNLRLINDLRSTKDYVRKNKLFMQNKANFRKVKLNVTDLLTIDYGKMDTWSIRKTKPIQSQSKPIQSQYKAKTNPIQTQTNPICSELVESISKRPKINVTYFLTKNYEKLTMNNELKNKANFQAQRIDGPVKIAKIAENVCFAHKGLCFIGRHRP